MSRFSSLRNRSGDAPALPALRVALWITVLLALLVYGMWTGNARETQPLNAELRQELGGTYIELEDGTTHFRIEGPYDGPLIVLVHGGTMAMFVWDRQAEALSEAGFQVLRYDAYGRGYSDRPDTAYTLDFAVDQLAEMADRFARGRKVHLAGVSVGALVSAAYSARHPDRVAGLTLISPVIRGVPSARGPAAWLARIPGLGEFAMRVYGMDRLQARARAMLDRMPQDGGRMARLFLEQMRFEGYERAMLSTMRQDLLRDQRSVYQGLGKTDVPVQVLWGDADGEITPKDMAILRDAVPAVAFRTIPDAGHALMVERGTLVSEAVIGFHRGAAARGGGERRAD